jgi:hypothetical protein
VRLVTIPGTPGQVLRLRKVVVRGLRNPRGLLVEADGSLVVATAGSGTSNDGALLRLAKNPDGTWGPPAALLEHQPSRNLIDLVHRDEIFGLAGLKRGDDEILLSTAFFDGPSRISSLETDRVRHIGSVRGNLNDMAWDPRRRRWFGVSSSNEELVHLKAGHAERILRFPSLAQGQDAVPGYLRFDPFSGDLLVSLFSGSPLGEDGGDGTELVPRAGRIVRVDPDAGSIRTVVGGLTAPTDFEVSSDGKKLWVLEFCDSFVEPLASRDELFAGTRHGGFRRFSGRLLEINRMTGTVQVIADGLDAPTNLARAGDALFVSEGMGTPGRLIPGPTGSPIRLDGFVEQIDLRRP